ncbi:hypothetical protein EKE94_07855 [Mesobaculum littorinae]|uniref:Dihydroorotate dehydrogenase n=1 Tax=Mesobaculum littorinae TaxID=2486419 RepID=A0A438AJH3_9RHOB|nr:hypothetical protein [Mesobaculum littorinae]RVV98804.1 hypothetical protein EKE94_07855 [Mesobaculum littorinae]
MTQSDGTPPTDPGRDDPLDALFAQARRTSPVPSARLIDAVLRDAAAEASAQAPATQKAVRHGNDARHGNAARRGWLARLGGALGGWPGVAGLTAAAAAGVWIGAAAGQGTGTLSRIAQLAVPGAASGIYASAPQSTEEEAASYVLADLLPAIPLGEEE